MGVINSPRLLPRIKPTFSGRLNRAHPLANGLVGFWAFNEGGGLVLYDSCGIAGNAALVGGTQIVGPNGRGVRTNGISDTIQVPDRTGLRTPSTAITLITQIRIPANPGDNAVYASKKDAFALHGFGLINRVFNTNTDLQGRLHVSGTDYSSTLTSVSLSLNTIYTLALTWQSGSGMTVSAFDNKGNLAFSNTETAITGTIDYDSSPLYIGNFVSGSDNTTPTYYAIDSFFTLVSARAWGMSDIQQFVSSPFALLETPRTYSVGLPAVSGSNTVTLPSGSLTLTGNAPTVTVAAPVISTVTSSLLISNGDIPYNSLCVFPSVPADQDLNEYNLIGGRRYSLFKFGAPSTSNSVRFDIGTGVTKATNHLIISRADILISSGCTSITLAAGSDGVTFGTTIYSNSSFASATLVGPHSSDFVAEIATSSAFQWYRISYSGSSGVFAQSTISFGSWFDFGIDVSDYSAKREAPDAAPFISDSGAQYQSRVSDPVYKMTFTWTKVTSPVAQKFFNTFGRYVNKQPVFFYTPVTNGRFELLDNKRLINAMITSIKRVDEFTNQESITIEATEILG